MTNAIFWDGGTWSGELEPPVPPPQQGWSAGQAPPFDVGGMFTSVVWTVNNAAPGDTWSIDWHDGTPLDRVGPISGATQTRAWHVYPIPGTFPPPTATRASDGLTLTYPHAPQMVAVVGAFNCVPVIVTQSPVQSNVPITFQLVNGCDGLAGDILRVQWGIDPGTEDFPATVGPPLSITPAAHTYAPTGLQPRITVELVRGGTVIGSSMSPPIQVT